MKRLVRSIALVAALCMAALSGTARAQVGRIDTAGLAGVAASPEVFLLDVRTPGEYRQGHIQGTVLIPMNEVPNRLAEIPRDKKVVVICASGARSGAVSAYLDKAGYPDVVNYVDGVMGWSRRHLPLERGVGN